jgi:hypothetical protein
MPPRGTKFPFPRLPKGEVSPRHEPGHWHDLVRRDIDIIRWFIEQEMALRFSPSPLLDLLTLYAQVERNASGPRIEDIPTDRARFGLHITAQFERLAWAVRALYGNDAVERIDATFVTDEILDADTKEQNVERKLPAGVGTLMFAARLVQAGGGRVCIYGHRGAGHDIRWLTGDGDLVLVERKDRSYEAGLKDTAEKRIRRVIDEVRSAHIPPEPGACRILVVGFQHLVGNADIAQTDRAYQTALEREFENTHDPNLPHVVVIEHLGLEPRTGGEKSTFFSPQPIQVDDAKDTVLRLVVRALGVDPD